MGGVVFLSDLREKWHSHTNLDVDQACQIKLYQFLDNDIVRLRGRMYLVNLQPEMSELVQQFQIGDDPILVGIKIRQGE